MAHPHSRSLHIKLTIQSLQDTLATGTPKFTQAPTAHLHPAQKEEALPPPADGQDHSTAVLRADHPCQLALAPLAELPRCPHLQQGACPSQTVGLMHCNMCGQGSITASCCLSCCAYQTGCSARHRASLAERLHRAVHSAN